MRISRHRRRRFQQRVEEPKYRANDRITVPEVRVIDDAGAHLGVMPTAEAIALAQERGLDLVEISPKDVPPICKFLNYGQFKYEQEKKDRLQKAHAKKVEVKGVRLSLRIGTHDMEIRKKQAMEFLEDGDKVQVELILRGREKAHAPLAEKVMYGFVELIKQDVPVRIEQPVSKQGGRMTLLVAKI